jgi:sigma-70-like protein
VAVVLCDIEGLTYEEIAATLGIKLGTVLSRIHRGRVPLRQTLAHLAPGRVRTAASRVYRPGRPPAGSGSACPQPASLPVRLRGGLWGSTAGQPLLAISVFSSFVYCWP